ncbi:hypothetical protein COM78_20365 [Bacillus thuringiensis]|uniref:hypothetical protein n=1 Tax=Bacillus thuringiensis TaxID=1428 RepID=UPI000BEC767A|nr:hypothetical protein [Bacillus thuringiensis]PDX93003.1 hypothetical protein COM78_20365 [Bacillus thuringiensis]
MELNYNSFSKKSIADKIFFLEDCFEEINFDKIPEKEIKKFFRALLEEEDNSYARKKGIEILGLLTLLNKVKKRSTVDILLDIEDTEEQFVLKTALTFLWMFYDKDSEITEKLLTNTENISPDVSSEAYYRLGLIKLFDSSFQTDRLTFAKNLKECHLLFNYSRGQIENRTDAEYFYHVTSYLQCVLSEVEKEADVHLKKLLETSWFRRAFHFNQDAILLEYKLNKVLIHLQEVYKSILDHQSWIDFHMQFKKLSEHFYELMNLSISHNPTVDTLINEFSNTLKTEVLEPILTKSLSYHKLRIDNTISHYKEDKDLVAFLNHVKEIIEVKERKKETNKQDVLSLCLKINKLFPNADIDKLLEDLETTNDISNTKSILGILNIISKYTESIHDSNLGYATGFAVGEEILNNLLKSIESKIPNYNGEKLQILMQIMEEMIRYLILTVRGKKNDYKFLYTTKNGGKGDTASERDLQDSLYKHFMYTKIADLTNEEIINYANGGRVDIVINVNNYKVPIELKKTKKEITSASVKEKYLDQVSTYIYSYDQLGVFVLLDLNAKDRPVNDLRTLIYLEHMEPLYKLDHNNKFPDYIIVVIIPGNKPLPSDLSKYT